MVKKTSDNRYGVSTNPKGCWSSSMIRMGRLYWQCLRKVSHATWSVCYGLNMNNTHVFGCESLHDSLPLFEPQFPYLENGIIGAPTS